MKPAIDAGETVPSQNTPYAKKSGSIPTLFSTKSAYTGVYSKLNTFLKFRQQKSDGFFKKAIGSMFSPSVERRGPVIILRDMMRSGYAGIVVEVLDRAGLDAQHGARIRYLVCSFAKERCCGPPEPGNPQTHPASVRGR